MRCLICDLILADEAPGTPSEKCKQCARSIVPGQSTAAVPLEVIEPPVVRPVAARILEDDLPMATPVVPTVQPRPRPATTRPGDVPYTAAKRAAPSSAVPPPMPKKVVIPNLDRPEPVRPKPKIAGALAVLGCMTILLILTLSVIAFAIVVGLKKAASKAEAAPSVRPL